MYNFYNYTSAHSETSDGRKQVLVVPDPSAHLMVPRDGLGALSARVEYTHPCEWVAHMHAQAKREGDENHWGKPPWMFDVSDIEMCRTYVT